MADAKRLQVALVAAVCVLFCCLSAVAEESLGEEYNGWELASFELTGVSGKLASTLAEGLALSGQRRVLSTTYPPYAANLLRDDMRRTKLFLARKGYPHARIAAEFKPHPGKQSLQVLLHVTTGERVIVDGFELRGIEQNVLARYKQFPLRPGDSFDQDAIEAARVKITLRVREYGYANATTTVAVEERQAGHVQLIFHVALMGIQYFGDVLVDGVPPDLEKVARRSVQVRRGALYSPLAMKRSEENLRYLGLFRRVKLQLEPSAADTLDLHLDLSERSHKQLQTGVGYFTEDRLRLRIEWSHNNLFREGRGLGIVLRGTQFEQRFGISVWKPALIVARTRGTISTSIARENEANYEALLTSASAWITQIWSLNTTLRYGVEVSYNDYKQLSEAGIEFEQTAGLLTAADFSWVRETARDRLWPLDGSSQSVRFRWALPGISESQFVLLEPGIAFYRKPHRKLIVSGRLRLGLGGPTSSVPIPPNERFYSGGSSSHRGFERRKLGPKDTNNEPLGGAAKVESSIELRFPLFRSFFGAGFVDAGQVWSRMQDARGDDIEIAGGLGFMFKTPAGPLRVDYAWRLTYQDTLEPRAQFHFSIGNPY